MTYSNNSPYLDSYGISYEEGDSSLERIVPSYTLKESDISHTVMEGETLQSIAFRYYRDSGLWYVIADTNPQIIDPFNDVVKGITLIIPTV